MDPRTAENVLGAARAVAVPLISPDAWRGALAVAGLALLLGFVFLPRARRLARADAALLRLAIGLPIVSLLVLGAGQSSGLLFKLNDYWFWGGLAGWLLALATGVWAWRRGRAAAKAAAGETDDAPTEPAATPEGRLMYVSGWAVVALVLAALLAPAFCPSTNYDVLEYHLGIVPHIFAAGRVGPIPHVFYSAQPIATELLYTLSAIVERTPWGYAPGALHWLLIVLGALLVGRVLRLMAVPAAWRPWLVLLLLNHPIIFKLELDRLTDWTGVVLLAGGIGMCLLGRRTAVVECGVRNAEYGIKADGIYRYAVLMGLFAGGAVGVKWTNAGTVALPLVLLAFFLGAGALDEIPTSSAEASTENRRWNLKSGLTAAVLWVGIAFLSWLPWGVWLWAVRGNPFAPFLAGTFPTAEWPPERLNFLLETHGPLRPWQGDYWANLALRLATGPSGPPYIALALVAAAAVLLLRWAARRDLAHGRFLRVSSAEAGLIGALAAGALAAVLLWGQLRHGADRFLAPTLLLAVLLIGLILSRLVRRAQGRRLAAVLLALPALWGTALNFAGLAQAGLAGEMVNHARGELSRRNYWRLTLGLTADLFDAANRLPAGSRIVAVNEARRYPFTHPISLASVFDESPIRAAVRGVTSGEEIRQRLVKAGYTHLLVNEAEEVRILGMHTPLGLMNDPALKALVAAAGNTDQAVSSPAKKALAEQYWGYTEFSVDPLSPSERKAYGDFLAVMGQHASWVRPTTELGQPEMWIAKIE